MRIFAFVAAFLLPASLSAADSVAARYFSSDWAAADPSAAPAPATPKSSSLLDRADVADIFEKHARPAHMSITRAAYLFYQSRYEGGELSRYIGRDAGLRPASDRPDNVVAGAFDEDSPSKNPWGETVPQLRHFWDCRKGLFAGLAGFDSSVNRAQKYFTGGRGLDGADDRGWDRHETRGHGILWQYRGGDKALAYWYLGHAAHLLEDATVPAHVLLVPHPLKGMDAYETFMGDHYAEWTKTIPAGDVEAFVTLPELFQRTAEITNRFDAGSGKKFTQAKLRAEGDVLMPLACRRVAALFLYFFRQVDQEPPRVSLLFPGSADPGAPDAAAGSRVELRAAAIDDVSGVDRAGYLFEYAIRTETGWSEWRRASAGTTSDRLELAVEPGRRYAVRVSAADAAGNRAYSRAGYLDAAAPLLAAAR